MRNFEKLKGMNIDEAAEWLWEHVNCDVCPVWAKCNKYQENIIVQDRCKVFMKEYLESEVEPENEVCGSCAIDFSDDDDVLPSIFLGEDDDDDDVLPSIFLGED